MGDGSPSRFDAKGKGRAAQNGDVLALNLGSAEEGATSQNGGAFMQMQLVEQQVCYISKCISHFYSCPHDLPNAPRIPISNRARQL